MTVKIKLIDTEVISQKTEEIKTFNINGKIIKVNLYSMQNNSNGMSCDSDYNIIDKNKLTDEELDELTDIIWDN